MTRSSGGALDALFFSPSIGPVAAPDLFAEGTTAGGSETQIWLIARGLAARGHAVGVVVRDVPPTFPHTIDGVRFVQQPADGSTRFAAYASYARTARLLLSRPAPRVFVQRAAGVETALVALIAALSRRPFIYSSAHVVDFDYSLIEPSPRRVRLFEAGVRRARRIVVQTEEQRALCERRFGRPGVVIRSIAEPARERSAEPEAFLWLGRFDSWKNPGAYLDLARSLPEARFRMVAARSNEPELARRITRQAAAIPNLELISPRPRAEALELLDRAVAIVSTSDFEGMPNVFLEAWARGVPALALRHDPDGVIARHGLGGFAAGVPDRLAEMAEQLWSGRGDQGDLAARCRRHVSTEHSLDRALDGWEAVLGACGVRAD